MWKKNCTISSSPIKRATQLKRCTTFVSCWTAQGDHRFTGSNIERGLSFFNKKRKGSGNQKRSSSPLPRYRCINLFFIPPNKYSRQVYLRSLPFPVTLLPSLNQVVQSFPFRLLVPLWSARRIGQSVRRNANIRPA